MARSDKFLESVEETYKSQSLNESGQSWSPDKTPPPIEAGSITEFDAHGVGKFKLAIIKDTRFGARTGGSHKYVYVSLDKKSFVDGMYSGGVTGGGITPRYIERFDQEDVYEFIKFV